MPARCPSASTTGRWLWWLVGDFLRHPVGRLVVVGDDRVGGHQLRDLGGEGFLQPLLEALHRADEDDPAHDVEVVRQVQVGLLLAEDQVRLADDADDLAVVVDDRNRAEVGLRQQVDRGAGVVARAGRLGTSRSMISPAVFIGARLFDRAVGTQPRGDRVDHVAGDHRLRRADPRARPRGRRGRGRRPPRRRRRRARGRGPAAPR